MRGDREVQRIERGHQGEHRGIQSLHRLVEDEIQSGVVLLIQPALEDRFHGQQGRQHAVPHHLDQLDGVPGQPLLRAQARQIHTEPIDPVVDHGRIEVVEALQPVGQVLRFRQEFRQRLAVLLQLEILQIQRGLVQRHVEDEIDMRHGLRHIERLPGTPEFLEGIEELHHVRIADELHPRPLFSEQAGLARDVVDADGGHHQLVESIPGRDGGQVNQVARLVEGRHHRRRRVNQLALVPHLDIIRIKGRRDDRTVEFDHDRVQLLELDVLQLCRNPLKGQNLQLLVEVRLPQQGVRLRLHGVQPVEEVQHRLVHRIPRHRHRRPRHPGILDRHLRSVRARHGNQVVEIAARRRPIEIGPPLHRPRHLERAGRSRTIQRPDAVVHGAGHLRDTVTLREIQRIRNGESIGLSIDQEVIPSIVLERVADPPDHLVELHRLDQAEVRIAVAVIVHHIRRQVGEVAEQRRRQKPRTNPTLKGGNVPEIHIEDAQVGGLPFKGRSDDLKSNGQSHLVVHDLRLCRGDGHRIRLAISRIVNHDRQFRRQHGLHRLRQCVISIHHPIDEVVKGQIGAGLHGEVRRLERVGHHGSNGWIVIADRSSESVYNRLSGCRLLLWNEQENSRPFLSSRHTAGTTHIAQVGRLRHLNFKEVIPGDAIRVIHHHIHLKGINGVSSVSIGNAEGPFKGFPRHRQLLLNLDPHCSTNR